MKTHPIIKHMNVFHNTDFDRTYYATSRMRMSNEGMFVEEYVAHYRHGKADFVIVVKHLTENDAELFTLYQGDILSDIQTYRILKDFVELHDSHSLPEFLEMLRGMSVSYISSLSQSIEKNSHEIRESVKEDMDWIKEQALRGLEACQEEGEV